MTVTLTPHLEALVRAKVDGGPYRDVGEVIAEALALLDERDRWQRLDRALAVGEQGDGIPFTSDLLAQIDREVDERIQRGDTPNPDVCP